MSVPDYASLKATMDKLVALEETVAPDELRVYRWRPRGQIELPAIYNWIDPSPSEWTDTAAVRDVVQLVVIVAVEHSDVDEQMAAVEGYADQLRATFDPEFHKQAPLGIRRAERKAMFPIVDQFDRVDALAIAFQVELWLDRIAR